MKRYGILLVGGVWFLGCGVPCGDGEIGGEGFCYQKAQQALARGASEVSAVDLNEDGLQDLALLIPGEQPRLTLLIGQPSGAFVARDIALELQPLAMASGDLDGDGDLDLLLSQGTEFGVFSSFGLLTPLINDGDANLTALPGVELAEVAVSMVIADLNQDRTPDIAVATAGILFSGSVRALIQSDGSFTMTINHALNEIPSDLRVLDLDQDGDLDIEAEASGLLSTSLLRFNNPGDGRLEEPSASTLSSFLDDDVLSRSADLDGDGAQDTFSLVDDFGLLRDRPLEAQIELSAGGSDTFKLQRSWEDDSFIQDLVLTDLDGDEDLDAIAILEILAPNEILVESRVFLLENVSQGEFNERAEMVLPLHIQQTIATDADLDGRADLIFLDENGTVLLFPSAP